MGCRPSRNSLGRIADSTSEYNRCYIKELDKARRKQKKSALGGRRRTPTYNAFSSTTKCYERDEGASKITVRLSTDGSMLEIEQYDIDFTSNHELISETTNEDKGLEMRPLGVGSASSDILQNKRFSYGRSGSAPLLVTDSLEPLSMTNCEPSSSGSLRNNCDSHASGGASDINKDSIIATSNAITENNVHSIVAVNVHNEERRTIPNIDESDHEKISQKYIHSVIDLPPAEGDVTRSEYVEHHSDIREIINDDPENLSDPQRISGGALTKCLCKRISKTICSNNQIDKQVRSVECMYSILTDGSEFKLVSNSGCEVIPSECDISLETGHIENLDKVTETGEIDVTRKSHKFIENQNACDRFLSYCFVCEKDRWRNEEAYCACINNKCHTLISPNKPDFGTDSNANVCCCRRYSSHDIQNSLPTSSLNTNEENKHSSLTADDKMLVSYQTRPNSSNSRDKYKYHPMNAGNPIKANIDFQGNRRCNDSSGQPPFSGIKPNVLSLDHHSRYSQISEQTRYVYPAKECHEKMCLENMRDYSGIGHTCCDKNESVTMATNDVSETTLRNDGQIRCYHPASSTEETQFPRNGLSRLYCNGKEQI